MLEFVNNIVSNLGDNPYFGAGFGLVGVGAGLTAARRGLNYALIFFKRHYVMTLEVTHRDPSYPWMLNWLTHHHKNVLQLNMITQFHQRTSGQFISEFTFVPSVGVHYFMFRNKWMKVERERQQTSVDLNMGVPFETIKFTCLGRDKKIFSSMADYAKNLEQSKHHGKTVIYEPRTSEWVPFGEPRRKREYNSVILHDQLANQILDDVKEFLNSREWYSNRGISHHRGYLLHGPPGCGKTSYVRALAGELGYDICPLNLGNSALSDERLSYLMNVVPPKCIVLMEDIDAAFHNRENIDPNQSAYRGLGQLTLSGILNVLDGAASSEDRILFMTTNYRERLDPALIRPGRVDMEVYIGYASDEQLARAFKKFYPRELGELTGDSFVEAIDKARPAILQKFDLPKDKKIELSMADVQSHFLLFKDKPQEALEHVDQLLAPKVKLMLEKAHLNRQKRRPSK